MRNAWRLITGCVVLLLTTGALAQQDHAKPFRSEDPGVSVPVVVKEVHAQYTRAAMEARLQGAITMDAVVRADGSIGDITITQPLDNNKYGMDERCVKALTEWQFKPGTKDDKAVDVIVTITMSFSLK